MANISNENFVWSRMNFFKISMSKILSSSLLLHEICFDIFLILSRLVLSEYVIVGLHDPRMKRHEQVVEHTAQYAAKAVDGRSACQFFDPIHVRQR